MGSSTGGLRLDMHAALEYPIAHRLSFEVSLAVDLTQSTNIEFRSAMPLPDEPRLFVWFGAGLRYGEL